MFMSKFNETDVLDAFRSEKPKKTVFGNYRIDGNTLEYRAQTSVDAPKWYNAGTYKDARAKIGALIREHDGKLTNDGKTVLLESLTQNSSVGKLKIQHTESNIVARKIKNADGTWEYIGNSDILDLVGRTVSYGNESRNTVNTEIQRHMRNASFLMLPLGDFEDADFSTFCILDRGISLNVTFEESTSEWSHSARFAYGDISATLFRLENNTYLFDCDKREAAFKKLNTFVTRVSNETKTIAAAYLSLKPVVVRDAERDGKQVGRIGKYFFIESEAPKVREFTIDEKLKILAGNCSYSIDQNIIETLVPGAVVRTQPYKELTDLIPQNRALGAKFNVPKLLAQDGRIYCNGRVTGPKNATLDLGNEWAIAVERVNHEKP
jgi:hypothetical protein